MQPMPPAGGGIFSPDGQWWWDGGAWRATASADGVWRWDGARWVPLTPAGAGSPQSVAALLEAAAEDRFAAGGSMLVARRTDWHPDPLIYPALARADELLARITSDAAKIQEIDHPTEQGVSRLLKQVGGQLARVGLERDREAASGELRQVIGGIGRNAPAGTFPEADAILEKARATEARAAELKGAIATLEAAEQAHAARIGAAQQKLAAAQGARAQAIAAAQAGVQAAEAQHQQAIAAANAQLAAVQVPGPGQQLGSYGRLVLHENVVETPEGRGPTDGAAAVVDTAGNLYAQRRDRILSVIAGGGPAAEAFQQAQAASAASLFVFLETEGADALVPVAPGTEAQAQQFAAAVGAAAASAHEKTAQRAQAIAAAESGVQHATAGTAGIDAARAALAQVEADEALSAPVTAAESELAGAQADTTARDGARALVQQLVSAALTPPPPLATAAAGQPPGPGGRPGAGP